MNDYVEMTGNHFLQNICVEFTGNFLNTFLTGNFIKLSVNPTQLFNNEPLDR